MASRAGGRGCVSFLLGDILGLTKDIISGQQPQNAFSAGSALAPVKTALPVRRDLDRCVCDKKNNENDNPSGGAVMTAMRKTEIWYPTRLLPNAIVHRAAMFSKSADSCPFVTCQVSSRSRRCGGLELLGELWCVPSLSSLSLAYSLWRSE